MSIYKVGKCDYCGESPVIVRCTPFFADVPATMCKICWNFTKEEYADSHGEYIDKFESQKQEYEDILYENGLMQFANRPISKPSFRNPVKY